MKRVLFITHDASRTGAPIVLLHFLKWLNRNTDIEISLLIKRRGPLEHDFAQLTKPIYWNIKEPFTNNSFYNRILKRVIPNIIAEPPKEIINKKFDLIYCNTVDGLMEAVALKKYQSCPLICHVHENEYTLNYFYPKIFTQNIKNHIDHYIAVSQTTKQNLIEQYDIPEEKIMLCYEFVPVEELSQPSVSIQSIKNTLGIRDEFIIGASGLTTWRKGVDLFVRLAHDLKQLDLSDSFKLVWVGEVDRAFKESYEYESKRLDVTDLIIFTGAKSRPQDYFQIFDVFTLVSREDPFPLVCLEVASLGKPILCFDQSGGMVEFIEKELVIPYADTKKMALKISNLMRNPNMAYEIGSFNRRKVSSYDTNKMSPTIYKLITSISE